ncbi:MAG TPA: PH domain-containing protein [Xanthobacteraceae bacterium]|nr:PH domain-containing protein [Xanthobacteraceae bacterium]
MGRYIDDILQPGEKLLYSTNLHWIFYLPGLVGWVVAIALLIGSQTVPSGNLVLLCLILSAAAALIAFYLSFRAWFKRWTTETDVTSLRVVHKEGFIKRRTFEISIDKVESVDVNQSILGRILNYGDVTIRGVGEGVEKIRTIAAPLAFRNFITAR